MIHLMELLRRAKRGQGHADSDPLRQDLVPSSVTVGYDRLKLLIHDHVSRTEVSHKWLAYLGISLSMLAAVATGDFTFTYTKLGLDGGQWQLLFIVIAVYTLARCLLAFRQWLTRPSPDVLIGQIVAASEHSSEDRAILVLKQRNPRTGFRILVYWDHLWECYLLPHYNLKGLYPSVVDDPGLVSFIASFIGCEAESVTVTYVAGCDLRSQKLSEYYRQGTTYNFSFFHVRIREDEAVPVHLRSLSFLYSGRQYAWMTVSEMEADENTRRRNIDMTRHLADNEYRLLSQTPPSLPAGVPLEDG